MPRLIEHPTLKPAAGDQPGRIEEFAGRVNSGHTAVSLARCLPAFSPEAVTGAEA
jgi:hypothetical protein